MLGDSSWFSVLDLRDVVFCIPLYPDSQYLFAFQWTEPDSGLSQQLTWTILPQGFGDSPPSFGHTLAKQHKEVSLPNEAILQYMDDIFICSAAKELSDTNTVQVLNFLGSRGYSLQEKGPISSQKVEYLGYILIPRYQDLTTKRKEAISQLGSPQTEKQLRPFLRTVGFCRRWIPSFSVMAKPLYEALAGSDTEPLDWT